MPTRYHLVSCGCSEHYTTTNYLYPQSSSGGGWGVWVTQESTLDFPSKSSIKQLSIAVIVNVTNVREADIFKGKKINIFINPNHVYLVPNPNPDVFMPNPNQIGLLAQLLSSVFDHCDDLFTPYVVLGVLFQ